LGCWPRSAGRSSPAPSTETKKLDKLCVATERTIALLKERSAALIAAAVTGTLDAQ
jgi:hypothetical protein